LNSELLLIVVFTVEEVLRLLRAHQASLGEQKPNLLSSPAARNLRILGLQPRHRARCSRQRGPRTDEKESVGTGGARHGGGDNNVLHEARDKLLVQA
jgi:hypothetical protein